MPCSHRDVVSPAGDIIIDPNIFAVATGIEEHATYGITTSSRATRWITENLPGVRVSAASQCLVLAARNNPVREGDPFLRSLYHAIQAGMGMGIVSAGQLVVSRRDRPRAARANRGRRPEQARRRDRPAPRIAERFNVAARVLEADARRVAHPPVAERITHLVKGIDEHVERHRR